MPEPKLSPDEIVLAELLDKLINEKNIALALRTLREVQDTFSLHDEYLEKVGSLIK
jgi:hypothetical protein